VLHPELPAATRIPASRGRDIGELGSRRPRKRSIGVPKRHTATDVASTNLSSPLLTLAALARQVPAAALLISGQFCPHKVA
jgi:hypothetical protein